MYTCAVRNVGFTSVSYKLTTAFEDSASHTLVPSEQAAARQLFERCCQPDGCRQWRLANERKAEKQDSAAGTVVDTDLCAQFGTCDAEGHLVRLNARGERGSSRGMGRCGGKFWNGSLHACRCPAGMGGADLAALAPLADWGMSCPFPGDLFAQFTKLQYLYASYNAFTVRLL